MREGRGSDMIARFVAHSEPHGGSSHSIEWTRLEMNTAYISGMEKHFPRAKAVFDKFHVVQHANRAMEADRRLEQQDGVGELKRTDRLWLKCKSEMSPDQYPFVASLAGSGRRRRGRP